MTERNAIEIYQQRYETFRHLDNLRWLMFQIGVGTAGLVIGLSDAPGWHSWAGVGFVLFATGLGILRINAGVRKNGEVLKTFGDAIGDTDIPLAVPRFASLSNWMALLLIGSGILCLGIAGRLIAVLL